MLVKYQNLKKFEPLLEPLDLGEGVETPVWLLLPFPALHTVILRPVNCLERSLMEACISVTQDKDGNPLLYYEKMLSLIKKDYHGKAFEGNQCQKFIKEENLDKLRNLLLEAEMPDDLVDKFVQCFLDIGSVYTSCCG